MPEHPRRRDGPRPRHSPGHPDDGAIREQRRVAAAAPLRGLVAGYSGYREVGVPARYHRGLPSPYLTLILTLDDPLHLVAHPDPSAPPDTYRALIGGLHTAPTMISHDGRQSGVQVAVSPLASRALFGVPAGELAGHDLHAQELLGPLAEQLRERLVQAGDWRQRFAVLDDVLARRAATGRSAGAPPPELVRAWHRLVGSGGRVPVARLAAEIGWSSRHLGQRFASEIGLSPKTAARVARFDRARRALAAEVAATGRLPGLAGPAADAGYFDQAHLARDFGELAGCPPSRWLAEEFRFLQATAPTAQAAWTA